MSSPTVRATNEWRVNGGDDILQIQSVSGTILGGIDSSSAGFGALAGGGTPAGGSGDIQINNSGVFGTAADINPASFVFVDSGNGGGFQAVSDATANHGLAAGQNSLQVLGASGSNRIVLSANETGSHIGISADSSITITSANAGVSLEGGSSVLLTADTGSVIVSGPTVSVTGTNDISISGNATLEINMGGDNFINMSTTIITLGSDNNTSNITIGASAGDKIGFYATAPIVKPTVTGSKGANAALTSLMTALAALGIVTDSTT